MVKTCRILHTGAIIEVNSIDATVEEVEHLRVDSADQLDAGSLGSFTLSQGFF